MGTNYYVGEEAACPTCGHVTSEPLHIGKSSVGWEFLFAPYPELGLTSWKAWRAYLETREIRDEYGGVVPLEELERLIEAKRGGLSARNASAQQWGPFGRNENRDDSDYRFSDNPNFS